MWPTTRRPRASKSWLRDTLPDDQSQHALWTRIHFRSQFYSLCTRFDADDLVLWRINIFDDKFLDKENYHIMRLTTWDQLKISTQVLRLIFPETLISHAKNSREWRILSFLLLMTLVTTQVAGYCHRHAQTLAANTISWTELQRLLRLTEIQEIWMNTKNHCLVSFCKR